MKTALILVSAALMTAGSAQAQDVSAQVPAQPSAGDVSDQEVERFALAALLVQQIAADSDISQEQKQTAMANVLNQTGLQPDRFNAIAKASQSDPELTQRIEAAAAAHVETARQQSQ